jgi:hypothetical protein
MRKIEKKSFYKVRHFRISDEVYNALVEKKKNTKGTWNYFFLKFIKKI